MVDEPSAEPSAGTPVPRAGVGEQLRQAREVRQLSLEQASEMLRIEPRFLEALENERFDEIGAAVFVKGYLRNYADLLGIDPRPLLAERAESLGAVPPPQARRSVGLVKEKPIGAIALGVIGAALLLGILWKVVWAPEPMPAATVSAPAETPSQPPASRASESGSSATPRATARPGDSGAGAVSGGVAGGITVQQAPAAELPAQRAPVERDAAVERSPPVEGGAPVERDAPAGGSAAAESSASAESNASADRSASAASADIGASADRSASAASAAPGASAASDASAAIGAAADRAAAGLTPAANGAALEIELRFDADSWTEVTSAAGERLFYGLGRQGDAERFASNGDVRVLLGNADGVSVRVNGAPYDPPAGSRRGETARFTISANSNQ